MQAYARAELAPPESELRLVASPPGGQATPLAVTASRLNAPVTKASALASLLLDGLDDQGCAALARRLLPFLGQAGTEARSVPAAYTVASLAAELGISPKAIRCAIARRELAAVKRGARWIISADAVRTWSGAPERRRTVHRSRAAAVPKSAGPSLRSVLCEAASRGGSR
jgi:hypothetical protein